MAARHFRGSGGEHWSYDPSQQLGKSGGFGVVYAGWAADGTEIAVKRVPLGPPDHVPVELRLREVDIAKKIRAEQSQYLVQVLDARAVGRHLLIVMERAEHALSEVISPDMGEESALAIMRDLAAGLEELHQAGVLHRDLKPANALLHNAQWKLADFGIARDVDQSTGTLTWAGAGTLAYMAPELFEPPGRSTVKSDLYALGCVAYELLTGAPPFAGPDEAEFIRQHREVAATALPSGVNVALRRIVTRLLNKDPTQRPQDARAVGEALGRVVITDGSPEAAAMLRHAERHDHERADKSARERAEAEAHRQAEQRRAQAIADLKAIIEDGHGLVSQVLPDVQYDQGLVEQVLPDHQHEGGPLKGRFRLRGDDAVLTFTAWDNEPPRSQAVSGRVLAGVVDGDNRRHGDEPPLGNVLCEVDEGRLLWYLYRFRRNVIVGSNYRLGPQDRRHGFLRRDFWGPNVWPYLGQGGAHIFTQERTRLTPESVRDLYRSAMALPDDD